MYKIYQVQAGDTLSSIAQKFNILKEDLAILNDISPASILIPSTNIIVPKTTNPYFTDYIVKSGDNIYKIAKENNTTPSNILRLNGLNETDIIYPNQTITIPKKDTKFYITKQDDTLNSLLVQMELSPNELIKQNPTIYLTNDQLIVYKK
ncbi:MAG: LysM peptidoglycan-binding domain-containing protein [Bacilli bacterium]|nr:LysM peptidoglycan-binding domain-containing protein [Bacilli bacterium]